MTETTELATRIHPQGLPAESIETEKTDEILQKRLEASHDFSLLLSHRESLDEISSTMGLMMAEIAKDDEKSLWFARKMAKEAAEHPSKLPAILDLRDMMEKQAIEDLDRAIKKGEETHRSPLDVLIARFDAAYQEKVNAADSSGELVEAIASSLPGIVKRENRLRRTAKLTGRSIVKFFFQ